MKRALLGVIMLILLLMVTIATAEESLYDKKPYTTFALGDITYSIPSSWITEEAIDKNYHYAKEKGSTTGGMLYVQRTSVGTGNEEMSNQKLMRIATDVLNGVLDDEKNNLIEALKYYHINSYLVAQCVVDLNINGTIYRTSLAMIIDNRGNDVTALMLAAKDVSEDSTSHFFAELMSSVSVADSGSVFDVAGLTDNELTVLREKINTEISSRTQTEQAKTTFEGERPLRDLFASTAIAKYVRDELGLISIDQPVTQAQLSKVTHLSGYSVDSEAKINDLSGIGALTGLTHFSTFGGGQFNELYELPDEFYTLSNLESICLWGSKVSSFSTDISGLGKLDTLSLMYTSIKELPANIGKLHNLKEIDLSSSAISYLPDSICNLTNLETLNISDTEISKLPEDIGNLSKLKRLDISGTKITSLPKSIYALDLDKFEKKDVDIE